MKIYFYIRFSTRYGQKLYLCGDCEELGDGDLEKSLPMKYLNEDFWEVSIEIDRKKAAGLQYKYVLQYENGERVAEWKNDRSLLLPKKTPEEIRVIDTWNFAGEYENAFYTTPFSDVLLATSPSRAARKISTEFSHLFKIKCPLLKKNEVVCLAGSGPDLREWSTSDPILLSRDGDWWTVGLNLDDSIFPVAYKYGIFDTREKQFVRFEEGDNRLLHGDFSGENITIIHDGFVHVPNNTWKGAGVAIPVFSLRSRKSFGVGEFTDLRLLIDWAHQAGLKLVQLLPVNDTTATHTWADSYPYAAISAFALHPIYINLEKTAGKRSGDKLKLLKQKQKQLNGLDFVDYDEVIRLKINILKELYAEGGNECFDSEDYHTFFKANRHWLVPYAAFCYLRDKYGTARFGQWKSHGTYIAEEIEKLLAGKSKAHTEIAFHFFIQYHLHLQLQDAVDYAHKKGIVLKGDIPIGVYRFSCDTWVDPGFYKMEQQAGAPPDDFAIKGQNWGFPTYDWNKMQADHFTWWRKRFEQMSRYFDAFRIDHILGFFRIWSIPMESVEGIMGSFDPAIPVTVTELGEAGIWFDYDRFCKPFITSQILYEIFGNDAETIASTFLVANEEGNFDLRDEFATQRQIDAHFSGTVKDEHSERIRHGLFELVSNVIFFEEKNSGKDRYHFRINIEGTKSYQHLDGHTKRKLQELYNDYFYYRQDRFWMQEAMHKLPPLKQATNMLICGEDLGMVPHCVPEVMKNLGILSLEIQRMPKNPDTEFFHPGDAPYLSVITPSTHDMSTIRGWWEEDRGKTQRFYNNILHQHGEAPYYCEAWVNRAIIMQHLYSPAMWSIFQLQDILGMSESLRRENPHEERINVPANARNYWRYRMHLYLEDLLKEKSFNGELKEYIRNSGR